MIDLKPIRSNKMKCPYDCNRGKCTAPDTKCPHWMGTFCELEETEDKISKDYVEREFENK